MRAVTAEATGRGRRRQGVEGSMRYSATAKTGARSRDSRRGAASVELALVVPLFFVLIFGTLEVSRVCAVSELLTNIARDGCRVAVTNGRTNTDAINRIDAMLSDAHITGANRSVTANVQTSKVGDPITVTVSVPFGNVSWLPMGYVLSSSMTLSGRAIMSSEHVD